GSDEVNEDGTTDLSSISMPALAADCLITAWIFWADALVAVWKSILRRLPSRARTPSAPRFQPPASRSWLALSTFHSQRVFFDRKRWGGLMKLPVAWPRRPRICSWMPARSTSRARAPRTAGSVRKGWVVFTLDRSPSPSVHGSVWLSWTWVIRPPK